MRSLILTGLIVLVLVAASAAQDTTTFVPRFQITFSGGGAWYTMENANRYVTWAKHNGFPAEHLNGGPNLGGEIEAFLSPHVSVGAGVDYVWETAGALFSTGLLPAADRVNVDFDVKYTAPRVFAKYHVLSGPWDYNFGVGLAYVLGNVKFAVDTGGGLLTDLSIDENGLGALAMAGASYEFKAPFTFGGRFGYRYYNAGRVDDPALDVLYDLTGINTTPDLDFRGLFFEATLGIRF